jgi:hypothetical protein
VLGEVLARLLTVLGHHLIGLVLGRFASLPRGRTVELLGCLRTWGACVRRLYGIDVIGLFRRHASL